MTTSRPNCCRYGQGQPGDHGDRFRLLAMDMEDRDHQHPGDIGGVAGGAGVFRQGGEADLVVEDDMDRAAGSVPFQLGEVEGLRHHPLAGKSSVAMHQQRQEPFPAVSADGILMGAAFPFDHRVDRFEMARVEGEGEMQPGDIGRIPFVIFDVTFTGDAFRLIVLEFGEDAPGGVCRGCWQARSAGRGGTCR